MPHNFKTFHSFCWPGGFLRNRVASEKFVPPTVEPHGYDAPPIKNEGSDWGSQPKKNIGCKPIPTKRKAKCTSFSYTFLGSSITRPLQNRLRWRPCWRVGMVSLLGGLVRREEKPAKWRGVNWESRPVLFRVYS